LMADSGDYKKQYKLKSFLGRNTRRKIIFLFLAKTQRRKSFGGRCIIKTGTVNGDRYLAKR
ncbi:MAG: hypothetical protein ACUVTX_10475, partial [Bacteroidales bacterium]